MSLIFRLAGQRLGSQILRNERSGLLSFVRPVTLKVKPATKCAKDESHDERNMRLKRPQSPHLTIYAPQLTSMLSITHRITGMVLSAYIIGLGIGAVWLPESIPYYLESLECAEIGSTCLSALKFSIAFPLAYHFWNGIRSPSLGFWFVSLYQRSLSDWICDAVVGNLLCHWYFCYVILCFCMVYLFLEISLC
ncbi:hypothetical protein NQ317_018365 [Molorchus minor]|uniref:Succinate dehydrogenase cytochrome b560 subunit, mitochondrial n=1 Tax=Molorchus minor TaxID=1323400 RepID=A0ABQ9JIT3_9CUCU|nr:hypothetical protein NQ317_018365 [Molorchus minor]